VSSNFDDVGEFHRKFGLPRVKPFEMPHPTNLHMDPAVMDFRFKFLQEELKEFKEGMEAEDIVGMADALIDLVYVAMGTAHMLGLPWQELWDDVQRANMSKERAAEDGSNSKRGSGLDVIKPEGWRGPHGASILKRHGFDI